MARSRNIKPSLFKNEILGTADPLLTILFESLWCLADREGRLEDRPLRIKAETFPYRDNIDVNGYLTELERLEFICRYTVENQAFIQVLKFTEHQSPHKTEKKSKIPPPPSETQQNQGLQGCTVKEPLKNDGLTAALPPDSFNRIPDSLERGAFSKGQNSSSPNGEKSSRKKFTPPTVEEVRDYCRERGNSVNAISFVNFYQSKGWKVGGSAMKCWKSCVHTWEQRDKETQTQATGSEPVWT